MRDSKPRHTGHISLLSSSLSAHASGHVLSVRHSFRELKAARWKIPGPCPAQLITRGEEADICINHSNVRKTLINAVTKL